MLYNMIIKLLYFNLIEFILINLRIENVFAKYIIMCISRNLIQ